MVATGLYFEHLSYLSRRGGTVGTMVEKTILLWTSCMNDPLKYLKHANFCWH